MVQFCRAHFSYSASASALLEKRRLTGVTLGRNSQNPLAESVRFERKKYKLAKRTCHSAKKGVK